MPGRDVGENHAFAVPRDQSLTDLKAITIETSHKIKRQDQATIKNLKTPKVTLIRICGLAAALACGTGDTGIRRQLVQDI
jgi:hypothetical protein